MMIDNLGVVKQLLFTADSFVAGGAPPIWSLRESTTLSTFRYEDAPSWSSNGDLCLGVPFSVSEPTEPPIKRTVAVDDRASKRAIQPHRGNFRS